MVRRVSRLATQTDPTVLRKAVTLLEQHNKTLAEKLAEAQRELATLRGESPEALQARLAAVEAHLAKLNKMVFGTSSEQRTTGGANGDGKSKDPQNKPKRGHGPTKQTALPEADVKHSIGDASDASCTSCGGELEEWVGEFEESSDVHVIPCRFLVRHHKRKKYGLVQILSVEFTRVGALVTGHSCAA